MGIFDNIKSIFDNETSFQRVSEANFAAKEQREVWTDNINKLIKSLNKNNPQIGTDYLEAIKSHVTGNDSIFSVNETDSGYVLSGELPLITKIGTKLDNFIARNPVTMYGVIFSETADIRKHFKEPIGVADPVIMLAGAYTAVKEVEASFSEIEQKISTYEAKYSIEYNLVSGDLKTRSEKFLKAAEETMKNISEKFENDTEKRQKDVNEFFEKSRLEIEATKRLASESETLKTARSIWRSKTNKHRISYGIGLALIISTILLMILFTIYNMESVHKFILSLQKPDKEVPYGIVVLILIPILAIAWILKIINKFSSNNLALAEDAEQREAMIDTYFRLVGNPEAKMESADRILVLNAIFRPLPGQQQEDLNPPNLIDVVSSAVSKK